MSKKGNQLFIDNDKYTWEQDAITGSELRVLGGIPEGVEIYLHVPGSPDVLVTGDQMVNLKDHHGPARFSTQSPGSQAG